MKQAKKQLRGWNAPVNQPYIPVGVPENVLPVLEGIKREIEHSKDFEAETRMQIAKIRRAPNHPMFVGKEPERTLKILYQSSSVIGSSKNQKDKEERHRKKMGKSKLNLQADEIDLVALGEGDPSSLMKRMKNIEDQFMANPQLHDPALKKKESKLNDSFEDD
jgi:hypothetical protein